MKINVGISARHLHINKEDFEILFGNEKELTEFKPLSQVGHFASNECVDLKTEKGIIENVRILGPYREYTQVEISRTDSHKLGIKPPVRPSGDIEGSESITIVGPNGEITKNCVIIADRHIHLSDEELLEYGLNIGQVISIKVNGKKGGIFENVKVRSGNKELHIDTDDANAFLLNNGDKVDICL